MLAYASNRPVIGQRPSSPSTMLLVISAHVALLAVAMSAKMEFARHRPHEGPMISIPVPPVPPPPSGTKVKPTGPTIDPGPTRVDPQVDARPLGGPTIDPGPIALGDGANSFPQFPTQGIPVPIRHEARLLTPADELRPPYPESKILSEEEATLQLRLTIDEHGRVTDVQPVGRADAVFLAAARRYLIAHWRYQPATEDSDPVASSQLITLHFQLDG